MNQFSVIQNFYKMILEKRAADTAAIMPNYSLDSREIALRDVEANKEDQRKQLMGLLNAAKSESTNDTKVLDKALPEAAEKSDTTTSNPLVKIAMNMAFFDGLRSVSHLSSGSADYLKTVYSSFNDELSRIDR